MPSNMLVPESRDTGSRPNKVLNVAPMQTYLVQYTDQQGLRQVRLVFRDDKTGETFILAEKLSGSHLVTTTKSWFKEGLSNEIAKLSGFNEGDVESV